MVAIANMLTGTAFMLAAAVVHNHAPQNRVNARLHGSSDTMTCLSEKDIIGEIKGLFADKRLIVVGGGMDYPTVVPDKPGAIGSLSPLSPDSRVWTIGWDGESPDKDLIQKWHNLYYNDNGHLALHGTKSRCQLSPAEKVVSNKEDVESSQNTLQMTTPVFDTAKSRAIVLFAVSGKGMENTIRLALFSKHANKWKLVGSRILSVS